jgi:RNA polymerase sigma-70 factor (ECF subfamily)
LHDTGSYSQNEGEIKKWLIRISENDEEAFSLLLLNFWNKVYTQALTYLKSSLTAQELTQDVFIRLWTNRNALVGIDNFAGYLFVMTKNEVLSQLRKKRSQPETPDETLPEEVWIPDQQLQYKQAYAMIFNGIERLPPVRKQVFKMSRNEGLSYDEIATRLNISRNGVKDHIVKALLFLRNYIRLHSDSFQILLFLFSNLLIQ